MVIPCKQTLVDERSDPLQRCIAGDVRRHRRTLSHRRRGSKRKSAAKDRERTEERPLVGLEQLVAPSDGVAQCSLPFDLIAVAIVEQIDCRAIPPIELFEQLRGRQDSKPGRCQLERERETVKAVADGGDRCWSLLRKRSLVVDTPLLL